MRELRSRAALPGHRRLALNFSVCIFAGHVVLLVSCITWGIQKVLFKIKEREALKTLVEDQAAEITKQATRIAELEPQAARVPQLEQQVADLVARVAQLENQKTQRPPE